jgi:hypothetical protein
MRLIFVLRVVKAYLHQLLWGVWWLLPGRIKDMLLKLTRSILCGKHELGVLDTVRGDLINTVVRYCLGTSSAIC